MKKLLLLLLLLTPACNKSAIIPDAEQVGKDVVTTVDDAKKLETDLTTTTPAAVVS